MCNFDGKDPNDLARSKEVKIGDIEKGQYHTRIYVTCNTCGKQYYADDHVGYHQNYWSWSKVYQV